MLEHAGVWSRDRVLRRFGMLTAEVVVVVVVVVVGMAVMKVVVMKVVRVMLRGVMILKVNRQVVVLVSKISGDVAAAPSAAVAAAVGVGVSSHGHLFRNVGQK